MPCIHATDASFEEEVLKATGPVLVDFWAEWCGPCRMVGPILEEISTEKAGKLKVVKVNIDESPATPDKYGVRGIPTLMVFKDGKILETKVGAMAKSAITAWLDKVAP